MSHNFISDVYVSILKAELIVILPSYLLVKPLPIILYFPLFGLEVIKARTLLFMLPK